AGHRDAGRPAAGHRARGGIAAVGGIDPATPAEGSFSTSVCRKRPWVSGRNARPMNAITIRAEITVAAIAMSPSNHPVAMAPATSGPAAVHKRPMLLVTAIADARTDGPNSSGKYTAFPESTPKTPKPTTGSSHMYMA